MGILEALGVWGRLLRPEEATVGAFKREAKFRNPNPQGNQKSKCQGYTWTLTVWLKNNGPKGMRIAQMGVFGAYFGCPGRVSVSGIASMVLGRCLRFWMP